MTGRTRVRRVAICVAVGLAFDLSACLLIARAEAATRASPITIVYRDEASNVRQMRGIAHYDGALGRDPSISFTIDNESGEQVCNGTFTSASETPRAGKFSLTCFKGAFSGNGSYERQAGDRRDSFIARGQTARGQRIMLVVGKPSGIADGQFLNP